MTRRQTTVVTVKCLPYEKSARREIITELICLLLLRIRSLPIIYGTILHLLFYSNFDFCSHFIMCILVYVFSVGPALILEFHVACLRVYVFNCMYVICCLAGVMKIKWWWQDRPPPQKSPPEPTIYRWKFASPRRPPGGLDFYRQIVGRKETFSGGDPIMGHRLTTTRARSATLREFVTRPHSSCITPLPNLLWVLSIFHSPRAKPKTRTAFVSQVEWFHKHCYRITKDACFREAWRRVEMVDVKD